MNTIKVLCSKQFLTGDSLTEWVNLEENKSRIDVVSIVPGIGSVSFLYLFYWEWQTSLTDNKTTNPQ